MQRISDTGMGIGKKKMFLSLVVWREAGWVDKKESVMKGPREEKRMAT